MAESTGPDITVGAPLLVNEVNGPVRGRYLVATILRAGAQPGPVPLTDPERVVNRVRRVAPGDLARLHHKPDALAAAVRGLAAPCDPRKSSCPDKG